MLQFTCICPRRRAKSISLVRPRLAPILLLLAFAALGSGLLERLHRQTHAAASSLKTSRPHDTAPQERRDDDGACELCLTLHLPVILASIPSLLIFVGFLAASHTFFPATPALQRLHSPIDRRGPPIV
jgi:hypothetical protein